MTMADNDMQRDKAARSVRGAVALITGAANGMGRATAGLLARQGARVALGRQTHRAASATTCCATSASISASSRP